MRLRNWTVLVSLLWGLSGCGGGTSDDTPVFTQADKDFLYRLFRTEYLWYDEIDENVDTSLFNEPQPMIDAIKSPQDRWSFAMDSQTYDDYVNQSYQGFGFAYDPQTYRIVYILLGSPAEGKLQRGDTVLKINGIPVDADVLAEASSHLGKASRFTIDRHGTIYEIDVVPDAYQRIAVASSVIEQNGTKIGYLRYDTFSSSSYADIEKAFDRFTQANVQTVVVDLRYNGGGSVTVASMLLDNLLGNHPGQPQFTLTWNPNYQANNQTYYFEDADDQDGNELTPTQLYFLVTKQTASASEALISALYPYLGKAHVITVGSATHGKNVGMQGRIYGDYYYFLINFYIANADGDISPSTGIPPTCEAEDDLDHPLGDVNETMLATALYYIQTGACPQ